jgi:hypothetical protein
MRAWLSHAKSESTNEVAVEVGSKVLQLNAVGGDSLRAASSARLLGERGSWRCRCVEVPVIHLV